MSTLWALSAAILAPLMSGCVLDADKAPLAVPATPDNFRAQKATPAPPVGEWPRLFGSKELAGLMDLAQAKNFDVAAAYARITQAEALAKLPLMNQPGSTWDYSRSTDVLGRIVEVVTGHTLGEELASRIFEPLGMKDTGFSVPTKQQNRIAEPFAVDPEAKTPVKLLDHKRPAMFESGGGGLASTASDYARYCAMLAGHGTLGKERILGRKTLELMSSDHLGPHVRRGSDLLPPGHGFGLGFAVRTAAGMSAVPGSKGLFYWGGIAGTTFWIDPQEDMFALLMIQAPGQRDYYRMLFRTLVYAAVE